MHRRQIVNTTRFHRRGEMISRATVQYSTNRSVPAPGQKTNRMNFKKTPLVAFLFVCVFALIAAGQAHAAVVITGASGGAAISADTAATGGSGAWTTLGAITI